MKAVVLPTKIMFLSLSEIHVFQTNEALLGEKILAPFIRGRTAGRQKRYYRWRQENNTFPNF